MTEREEQAVVVLNTLHDNPLLSDIHRQALEVGIMAIKALSSSEKPNKWIDAEVLDKIRAEIESVIQEETVIVHPEARNGYERIVSKLDPDDVFQIIDKYKAESEVQE